MMTLSIRCHIFVPLQTQLDVIRKNEQSRLFLLVPNASFGGIRKRGGYTEHNFLSPALSLIVSFFQMCF